MTWLLTWMRPPADWVSSVSRSDLAVIADPIHIRQRAAALRYFFTFLLGGTVMAGPGGEKAAAAAGRGRLRASHADREQMIDALKAAFVQGRLTKDEFDARIGQTFASRTYAELAAVTADIPAGLTGAQPPRKAPQWVMNNAVRWGASGFITPAILAAAFAVASVRGASGYGAVTFLVAFLYFMFWLSIGANMLWEWHCMSLPGTGICVRCGHTAASHRAPASCGVRQDSLKLWRRCPCAGYVPPGISPETADLYRCLPLHPYDHRRIACFR